MTAAARTPEELETLLEDAFVIRDRAALTDLFEDAAVLAGDVAGEAPGSEEISRRVAAMWERDRGYLAEPRRVVQARDTALVLGEEGIHVVRRGGDGAWRYAITPLLPAETTTKEEP